MSERIPTVILCGGRGSRMGDVTQTMPKPMVPIGEQPILWHIMKIYAASGYTDFILALGWLGEEIRRFFLHYQALTSDFTIEIGRPDGISYLGEHPDVGWKVTCLDTGRDALTGTRVRRAAALVPEGPVMVTYGDGVGDVDLRELVAFHREQGRLATITVVHPPVRFGEVAYKDGQVGDFVEKPQTSTGSISGGFMLFEREAIEQYIPADEDVMLEREPLSAMTADGQVSAYVHDGFWRMMDTPRDRETLEDLWASGHAPWKVWR